MFVLERLTDSDITRIVTQAVERVLDSDSPPHTQMAPSITALETPVVNDVTSSQITLDPSASPSMSNSPLRSQETQLYPGLPQLTTKILLAVVSLSSGDARTALSLLELVISSSPTIAPDALLVSLRNSVSTSYDRTGEGHYDMISALHKSVRGSQGSAALYWLARMLTAGEDPLYIARRMIVCASEDIGLADNHALPLVSMNVLEVHAYLPLTYWSLCRP